jgi:hypothetical protein
MVSVFAVLHLLYFGCTANSGIEQKLSPSGPVLSIDVDSEAKLAYLQNVKNSIKAFNQVVLDLRYYHRNVNFIELVEEIESYVENYVDEVLLDSEANSGIETRMEIGKLHLLVVQLYMDMGYRIKPVEYLEIFHKRYDRDAVLLEKSLDPDDIGYSTLGQGMRMLEERAYKEMRPLVHGKVYPWKKSRGKVYPWRNPKMEPPF